MKASGRVILLGATGFTGSLVARQLCELGLPLVLAARNADRLASLSRTLGGAPFHPVDVSRPDRLLSVIGSGDVVVNCAGPFSTLGEPVVAACVGAGAHYLDIAGEQRFMKRISDVFDYPAHRAGVVVVNGMAFEYAIGDCLTALLAEDHRKGLRSVDVFYSWPGGVGHVSTGTRRSVLLVMGEGGFTLDRGRLRERSTGSHRCDVRFPGGRKLSALWFPAGESITVPRHTAAEQVNGWVVVDRRLAAVVPRVAGAIPLLARAAKPLAEWYIRRSGEQTEDEMYERGRFVIQVKAVSQLGDRMTAVAEGIDPYGITAVIAARAAQRLAQGEELEGGVLSPAQLMDPRGFLEVLRAQGVTWDVYCKGGASMAHRP